MKVLKSVLIATIASLTLNLPTAQANPYHDSDLGYFYTMCSGYYWEADWPGLKSCAMSFWYAAAAYNNGQADARYSQINSPGWPIACPQGPNSENPMCPATYQELEDYEEAADLAEGLYNEWVEWTW